MLLIPAQVQYFSLAVSPSRSSPQAQAHLELRAVKARLTRDARDIELALLLCCLFPNKCGRGEEEAELLHGLQLLPQLLIRIHGETRRRNGHSAAAHNLCPQIVAHRVCDVIEYLHSAPPNLSHRDWLDQTFVPIITYFKESKRAPLRLFLAKEDKDKLFAQFIFSLRQCLCIELLACLGAHGHVFL